MCSLLELYLLLDRATLRAGIARSQQHRLYAAVQYTAPS
jgi:hypothetical protein